MAGGEMLLLHLRSQALRPDAQGRNRWEIVIGERMMPAAEVAVLICDMWDAHWARGPAERVAAMAPRLNQVVRAARARGTMIIHAPSETMEFYAGTPARERMLALPRVRPPRRLPHENPRLPVDASDGGSDTGEAPWYRAWTRQHPAIAIDQERDGISDDGREVYSLLQQRGIRLLVIMGVHTNMCVLGRSFAIRSMVRWGVDVALVRDLTDAMYNPARLPYVSHEEGTRLIVEYIEKFWCPTMVSADLVGGS